MSGESNGTLQRVAEAISDGIPIDWDTEKASRPDLTELLEELKKVETLAKVHGTAPGPVAMASAAGVAVADADVTRYTDLPDQVDESISEQPNRWGPLRILEKIGEGGFGEVYRAFDPALQIEVALKLWRPGEIGEDETERFLSEARKLARVRHPNVLTVHGAAEYDGRVGMWTDLLRGETLEERIAQGGTFSAKEASSIGIDICGALAAVHAAGLVHRDVKAANVMREQGGRIVLMDFGSGGELSAERTTLSGEPVFGTPIAMAPEQFETDTVGPAADIYSLGVLLFRLVSGRYPVEALTYLELKEKHSRREKLHLRDLRPDLPAEFVQVVERAIARESGDRFSSAGAMEQALATATGQATVRQPTPSPPVTIATPWWRRMLVPAAAAAAVVIAAILVWQTFFSSPGTLTASASLYRGTLSGYELLLPGASVAPGDGLSLEISGSDAMYVYILSEDETGVGYALFPVPGLEITNPLAPGETHRLPGEVNGRSVDWEVSSAGGRESIVVIASRKPLKSLEDDIAGFPAASRDRPVVHGQLSDDTMLALRGIGGLKESEIHGGAVSNVTLTELIASLPGDPEESRDPWFWQIQLENTGR
jgi:serine/threonine protein kinase